MKFKKGSKVEVLKRNDFPSGAWHSGMIINGNGHIYSIRYDNCAAKQQTIFERVRRKDIRPSPPSLGASKDWVSGDIVEVFDEYSWKMAMILKTLKDSDFMVRLLGFNKEFEVHRSRLRLRLSWQEDGWVIIGKVSRNHEKYPPTVNSLHLKRISSSPPLPRASNPKDENPSHRTKKRILLHTSKKPCGVVGVDASSIVVEVDDANAITSSVDSCSIASNHSYIDINKRGSWSSRDAESFCQPIAKSGHAFHKKEVPKSELHDLELDTYRRTMEVLHASGPLSWAQEAFITNLRLSLNISNDEHLMEIRDLISGVTRI